MLKRFLTIYIFGEKGLQHHMIGVLKKSLQLSGKKSVKGINLACHIILLTQWGAVGRSGGK